MEDEALCAKRHAVQLILSYHDSPMADAHTRRACVEVIVRAAELPSAAAALLMKHGILSWIVGHNERPQPAEVTSGLGLPSALGTTSGPSPPR